MSISAIILTYNEEMHIKRCIDSIHDVVDEIFVIDSYSTDNTLSILNQFENVSIFQHEFINHATQLNVALDYFKIQTDWIFRIDADEYIDNELKCYLSNDIADIPESVTGVNFNRYIKFLGRTLKYGGMSSYWILRLWRNGCGKSEQRWMDEHVILSHGDTINAKGKLIDDNVNSLGWWAHKHVDYATKEAIEVLIAQSSSCDLKADFFGTSSERKRFLKNQYNKMPLFIRPFVYFLYRFIFKLGFLDGKQGLIWCFMQGCWYRMMVDSKIFELKSSTDRDIKSTIKKLYGYDI